MSIQFKTPRSLLEAYKSGFIGAYCDKEELAELISGLKHPLFSVSAHHLYGTGEGKLSLPYKALLKLDPGFGPAEAQKTGDCVSHSTRNAADVTRAVEIVIKGEPEAFVARGATECIYGFRGHRGQGMTCSGASKFISDVGGILLRKKYDWADLSTYNVNVGINWGGRGVPDEVKKEGAKHQVKTVSMVHTVEGARDALANGYAISVCSNQGFSSRRDSNGIAKAQGSWNHAMAWVGCDDTRERLDETLFLIQNSWGKFNGGPKVHDQPDGSFWIRQSVAERMLRQDGSFVYSNVDGFEPRNIDWGNWDEVW